MDHTTLHPSCAHLGHLVDLHLWRGAPKNFDEDRPIQMLVNHGFVVGFCPDRLQPAWSAYRVAHADDDVDYDRPHVYYEDLRLPDAQRIGRKTFGKIGDVQLHVGHMTPNEVVNRQYGRLAQMETFFMSNMSPQYGSLNLGVWSKLEKAIREIEDVDKSDHVWAIVGPVFGAEPNSISRGDGKHLPIPDAYFCVIVDPHRWPWDKFSVVDIDCFLIPQDAPAGTDPTDYLCDLDEVELATNLEFFPGWGRDAAIASRDGEVPLSAHALGARDRRSGSRLMRILESKKGEASPAELAPTPPAASVAEVERLIEDLRGRVASLLVQGRELSEEEHRNVRDWNQVIAWLMRSLGILQPAPPPSTPTAPTSLITYKIEADREGRLKQGARTACNFWNRFVSPSESIVIRLGLFTQAGTTIARAYRPYTRGGTKYGRVEFNTTFLERFSEVEIAGTIVHEIGHSLGIGFGSWNDLFDPTTGRFHDEATDQLAALREMVVELDGGPGTELSHWDEDQFGRELMTGYQNHGEHVLPVTVDLMELLGHTVLEELPEPTDLGELLTSASSMVFTRHSDAMDLDVDYFEETELFETIPHVPNKS